MTLSPNCNFRTYMAVFALFFLNFVQVFALTGPPVVASKDLLPACNLMLKFGTSSSTISARISTRHQFKTGLSTRSLWCKRCSGHSWRASLPQPNWRFLARWLTRGCTQSFTSDTFQARKIVLIVSCSVSLIGAAIAPGSSSIYRVIVAQILIGVGFAAVPLAYAIPSEVSR